MNAASSLRNALGCLLIGSALYAGASAAEGSHRFPAGDPVWKEECGACHLAYPPQLLPAASWRALMNALDRHFGVDASLDGQTERHIRAFLESSAGRSEGAADGTNTRVTRTRWFRHEHDELPASVWKRPEVRSATNCAACHTQAEAGDYSGRTRRVPR